jgi:hypothetical protein
MLSAHFVPLIAKCALVLSNNVSPCLADLPKDTWNAWIALLHYSRHANSWVSDVKDKRFFIDSGGVADPGIEWEADYRAFVADTERKVGDDRAQCRFPARFALMKKIFDWAPKIGEERNCAGLSQFTARLNAKHVAVVYVSHYFGNAASAFGHTMLLLKSDSSASTKLSDYAVSFEADTKGMSPAKYLPRGLFGGLEAAYKTEPLYTRVRKYEQQEQRDLWLFPLNLDSDQVELLVLHVWELREISFQYGFFGGNCAEKILRLVNAVTPASGVSPYRKTAILPSDVVRRLVEKMGLNGDPVYRPSLKAQYQHRVREMDKRERRQLAQMVKTRSVVAHVSPRVISTAMLWSEINTPHRAFRRTEDIVDHPDYVWIRKLWDVRNTDSSTSSGFVKVTPSVSLLDGHRSSAISLRSGVSNGDATVEIGARWLLHAVPDPSEGYPKASSIEVGQISIAFVPRANPRVEEFTALRVENIASRSGVHFQSAWKFELGARRLPFRHDVPLQWGAEIGIGKSLTFSRNAYSFSLYSMAGLRPGALGRSRTLTFRPAADLVTGVVLELPLDIRSRMAASYTKGLNGDHTHGAELKSVTRKRISQNVDAELQVGTNPMGARATAGVVIFR